MNTSRLSRTSDLLAAAVHTATTHRQPAWSEWAVVHGVDPLTVILDSDSTQQPIAVTANAFGPVTPDTRVRVEHAGTRTTLVSAPSVVAGLMAQIADLQDQVTSLLPPGEGD